ncbi:hypothetical protein predicted by Glimmer/Critica [Sorangium cellulosum So ce56]|uniref:Uncharacterized protein n=1 Tax=Sorangium cellulosum (strain So ce56) TaxID=448385 RepID=A9GIX6_SORC5|nr:hypothetical protein predicted by Glimmer/Critica [Sorangium cellulosum So ce56]
MEELMARSDSGQRSVPRAPDARAPALRCYARRVQRWILVAVIAGLHLLAFAIGILLRRRRRRRRMLADEARAIAAHADAARARAARPR